MPRSLHQHAKNRWVSTHQLTIDLYHVTRGEQYVASLYWSVMTLTTIGYGDIKPVTAFERLFAILAMLLGSAMFAYVVGTMCSVVQGLSETELHFQSHMDRINEYMTECKLQIACEHGFENSAFINAMPTSFARGSAHFCRL